MNNENLKPFKEGDDSRRNTGGRPTGSKSFKKILDELLEMVVKDEGVKSAKEIVDMYPDGQVTYKQAMAVRMIAKAVLDPESKSAERIMNRTEGKPIETIRQDLQVTDIRVEKTILTKPPTESTDVTETDEGKV